MVHYLVPPSSKGSVLPRWLNSSSFWKVAAWVLEGGIGKLLGQLGPVPFFVHGKPQNLKIFEKNQDF